MLVECEDCGKEISDKSTACIHCGCPIDRKPKGGELIYNIPRAPKCPVCGYGSLERMDAGGRGVAFANGNLLGAFTRTHRCNSCGHLV